MLDLSKGNYPCNSSVLGMKMKSQLILKKWKWIPLLSLFLSLLFLRMITSVYIHAVPLPNFEMYTLIVFYSLIFLLISLFSSSILLQVCMKGRRFRDGFEQLNPYYHRNSFKFYMHSNLSLRNKMLCNRPIRTLKGYLKIKLSMWNCL